MPVTWIPGAGFVANAYLVDTILIDAGILPSAIRTHRGEINTIVLTHCHYDHTAYVREIAHMCNAGVAIHHLDAPGLSEDHLSLALHFGAQIPRYRCTTGSLRRRPGRTPESPPYPDIPGDDSAVSGRPIIPEIPVTYQSRIRHDFFREGDHRSPRTIDKPA